MAALVRALHAAPDVNYIGASERLCARCRRCTRRLRHPLLLDAQPAGLPTSMLLTHEARMCSRGVPPALFAPREAAGVRLLPLAAYMDSTHVARVGWYRREVFDAACGVPLPRGCYLEDTFGQAQLSAVRAGGAAAHARYGTFFAHAGAAQAVLVRHLDGHDGRSGTGDWCKWRHADEHTSEEAWAAIEADGLLAHDAPHFTLTPGFYDAAASGGFCAPQRAPRERRRRKGGDDDEEADDDAAAAREDDCAPASAAD